MCPYHDSSFRNSVEEEEGIGKSLDASMEYLKMLQEQNSKEVPKITSADYLEMRMRRENPPKPSSQKRETKPARFDPEAIAKHMIYEEVVVPPHLQASYVEEQRKLRSEEKRKQTMAENEKKKAAVNGGKNVVTADKTSRNTNSRTSNVSSKSNVNRNPAPPIPRYDELPSMRKNGTSTTTSKPSTSTAKSSNGTTSSPLKPSTTSRPTPPPAISKATKAPPKTTPKPSTSTKSTSKTSSTIKPSSSQKTTSATSRQTPSRSVTPQKSSSQQRPVQKQPPIKPPPQKAVSARPSQMRAPPSSVNGRSNAMMQQRGPPQTISKNGSGGRPVSNMRPPSSSKRKIEEVEDDEDEEDEEDEYEYSDEEDDDGQGYLPPPNPYNPHVFSRSGPYDDYRPGSIAAMFRRPGQQWHKNRYDDDLDDDCMEARFDEIEEEEDYSSKVAEYEDHLEEEDERRRRKEREKRKKTRR